MLAVAIMAVLAVSTTTIIYYSSSNSRSSSHSRASESAYFAAESGIAEALSRLNNASDPRVSTLLPATTISVGGASVTYSGSYDSAAMKWTITSTGTLPNPSGGATSVSRTINREASVAVSDSGPLAQDWGRIYHDSTSTCMTLSSVNVPAPLTSRGDLCLSGSTQVTGTVVQVGGTTTLGKSTNIGTSPSSSSPVETFHGAGGCKYDSAKSFTSPCGPADRVYAKTVGTSPTDLTKPALDWAYWYANAKPGPMYPCTESSGGGYLPTFDNNSTYDGSNPEMEITPEPGGSPQSGGDKNPPGTSANVSYTCRVRDAGGNILGELSWNNLTRVLTVKGVIFFDGNAVFHNHDGYVVHYQGRATIFIAKKWHNDEAVCAGGSGTTTCRTTADISSWDPSQNLLLLAVGDKNSGKKDESDITFHLCCSAFQGAIWTTNACSLEDGGMLSGPIICNSVSLTPSSKDGGGVFAFPPLGSALEPMSQGNPPQTGDFNVIPGVQTG